ncbi:putative protein MSS51 homolog, mitochondrial [Leptopilina boulardi]|uniref:putative protein MSS51 homolog, mitochondrial n=1 Tax=Leptopilina boulardi TaxID=63433 RepID=UPI0021F5A7FF|nr:putative protein MSS51 homolog, mitochondrial [Leptopilina boulardi]
MDYLQKLCSESVDIENHDESIIESSHEFYFPNMCHICRCFGEEANINLKRCGACQMISYCCKDHQIKDWSSHKQFCKVICQIKKEWKVNNVFQSLKSIAQKKALIYLEDDVDKQKYHLSLNNLNMRLVIETVTLLRRKLTKIEFQMISFPRICTVCYESNSDLLINCKKCPLSSFCKDHLNYSNHESECKKNIACFNTVRSIFYRLKSFTLFDKMMIDSPYYNATKKLPSSMLEFIEMRSSTDLTQFGKSDVINVSEDIKSTIFKRLLSDRFSRGFTTLFAIEKLSLNNLQSMVIHIVGSNIGETIVTDWEVILHFLPNLQKLQLIFIGPDVFSNSKETKIVCNLCKMENKKLIFETRKTLYHDYCREESFLKPDLIACFDPGFHVYKTWKKSIKVLNKGQCPLLVTAIHNVEACIDKCYIDSEYPSAKCIFNDNNPFAYICYQRQDIYYPIAANNQCLYIYESLDKKNKTTK